MVLMMVLLIPLLLSIPPPRKLVVFRVHPLELSPPPAETYELVLAFAFLAKENDVDSQVSDKNEEVDEIDISSMHDNLEVVESIESPLSSKSEEIEIPIPNDTLNEQDKSEQLELVQDSSEETINNEHGVDEEELLVLSQKTETKTNESNRNEVIATFLDKNTLRSSLFEIQDDGFRIFTNYSSTGSHGPLAAGQRTGGRLAQEYCREAGVQRVDKRWCTSARIK